MADLITYTDKVDNVVSGLPEINKVTAANMNELKNSINTNAGETDVNTADIAALEEIAGYVPFTYVYNSSVVPTGIAAGEMRLDSNTPSSVTHVFLHKEDNSIDVSNVIEDLEVSSYIYPQSRFGEKVSGLYKITAISDETTYMDYTVTVIDAYGTDISGLDGFFFAVGLVPDIGGLAAEVSANTSNVADLEAAVTQRALYNATTTGTVALDCSSFDSWYRILTGNTDFTFTNTPASGFTFVRTLEVITTAGESLTFSTADNVIGTFVNDNTTVNLITINFANYPTLGLRVTVVIS